MDLKEENKPEAIIFVKPEVVPQRTSLATIFGLNIHGNKGLTDAVRRDLEFAAYILLVVFVFEFFAWFMLTNAIVHGGNLKISNASIFAAIAALILAFAVWLYERQFFTANFSFTNLPMLFAAGLRLAIIAGSVLITSQPIEVLMFSGRIAKVAHTENVILEAVGRFKELTIVKAREAEIGQVDPNDAKLSSTTQTEEQLKLIRQKLEQLTQQKRLENITLAKLQSRYNQNEQARNWWESSGAKRRHSETEVKKGIRHIYNKKRKLQTQS